MMRGLPFCSLVSSPRFPAAFKRTQQVKDRSEQLFDVHTIASSKKYTRYVPGLLLLPSAARFLSCRTLFCYLFVSCLLLQPCMHHRHAVALGTGFEISQTNAISQDPACLHHLTLVAKHLEPSEWLSNSRPLPSSLCLLAMVVPARCVIPWSLDINRRCARTGPASKTTLPPDVANDGFFFYRASSLKDVRIGVELGR